MGFGYLLLGFIVWLNPVYSGFSEWLAVTLILSGLLKLAPYGKGFKFGVYVSVPLLVAAFANLVFNGADILGLYAYESSGVYNAVMVFTLIAGFVLRVLILWGVFEITAYTGLDNLKLRSVYYGILYSVVFVFKLLLTLRVIPISSYGFPVILFGELLIGIFVAFLIFACLRQIAFEGDDEEENDKKSEIKMGWWQKIKQMSDIEDIPAHEVNAKKSKRKKK